MSKQTIVGYDGSGPSLEAVMWAAQHASVCGTPLRIVSCFRIPLAGDAVYGWVPTEAFTSLMAATEERLALIRGVVGGTHPHLDITTEASAGPAGQVLVDAAEWGDTVVVGASGHQGAAAFWLGSTPRYIVRHSSVPVVVVRGAATPISTSTSTSISTSISSSQGNPDRVVVGVDGSPPSVEALRWAGEAADRYGVPLTVVHGWSYPYLLLDTGSRQAHDLTQIDAACVLERAVESAREQFAAEVSGELIENGPASAVLGTVRDGDLLVLGSRGRGAARTSLFGSTVNSVLDRCAVPVVVVRASDHEPAADWDPSARRSLHAPFPGRIGAPIARIGPENG
jgi:nucleotide-binding universal stress UspA family protein